MRLRARAQQLDARLISDLDASAGEQRDAASQIGQLRALEAIQLGARRAKLIIEMVNRRVALLADIAVLRFDGFAKLRVILDVVLLEFGRGERRSACVKTVLAPKLSNSRL